MNGKIGNPMNKSSTDMISKPMTEMTKTFKDLFWLEQLDFLSFIWVKIKWTYMHCLQMSDALIHLFGKWSHSLVKNVAPMTELKK